MKKITYLLTIITVLFMSFGCEKDPINIVPTKTLQEQYPEWSNLTYVSTNGVLNAYPRIDIKIEGNIVYFTETTFNIIYDLVSWVKLGFNNFEVCSTTITLSKPLIGAKIQILTIIPMVSSNDKLVKLMWQDNIYILQKN